MHLTAGCATLAPAYTWSRMDQQELHGGGGGGLVGEEEEEEDIFEEAAKVCHSHAIMELHLKRK